MLGFLDFNINISRPIEACVFAVCVYVCRLYHVISHSNITFAVMYTHRMFVMLRTRCQLSQLPEEFSHTYICIRL